MRSTRPLPILLLLTCVASACATDHENPPASGDTPAKPKPSGPLRDVKCVDAQIGALGLLDEPSDGVVRDESMNGGTFESFLDTTAGGMEPTKSFTYVRFSDKGLQRVAISDEDAFTSLDWDMAMRRFVIRLNSGVSGPGDVTGARTRPNTTFESLTSVPDGVDYREEQYMSDDCEPISDSGIGSPATALASFWSYVSCVAMTHNVYVIETQEMRHVKFEVLDYYSPANQKICNDTGKVPSPTGAGNVRIRWAYLD